LGAGGAAEFEGGITHSGALCDSGEVGPAALGGGNDAKLPLALGKGADA
jgi:hypothetical protein